jgi:hypothetical protein
MQYFALIALPAPHCSLAPPAIFPRELPYHPIQFSRYGKERLETELKALFGDSITEDGNSKLNFLEYLTRVKERAKVLAAAAAEEQKAKYAGAPGLKKKTNN